jgi:O-antigen ligase
MPEIVQNKGLYFLNKYRQNSSYYLAYLFVSYFILLNFIGRFKPFQGIVIWGIGPVFVILVFMNYFQFPFRAPKEVIVFFLFWLWTYPGYLSVIDVQGYFRYFRLVFTILVLFLCIEIVLIRTGKIKLMYQALVANGLIFFVYAIITGEYSTISDDTVRVQALVNNPNGFAYIGITGLTGVLFLWNEYKDFKKRLWLVIFMAGFVIMIVLTASRSGFITMILLFSFWMIFCYYKSFVKHFVIYIIALLIFVPLLYYSYSYIMDETYLGERFNKTTEGDETITDETRVQLYLEGFEMFKRSPFYGIGLSQFPLYSSHHAIAHSEYMELLATTGLIGLILMMYFYYILIKKNLSIRKVIKDPIIVYRLNLSNAIIASILVFGFFRANFLDILTMVQLAFIAGYTNYLAIRYRTFKEIEDNNG